MAHKYVYMFSEGNGSMRELLGGKGANLAEMTRLGLPVPQGFTVSTEACTSYYDNEQTITQEIYDQIYSALAELEKMSGKTFGGKENPLLVSVRSGARASMPGMMDTILNLGLNDEVVEVFAKKTNNPRFAYDSYRRFIQMYSDVVMEVGKNYFEKLIDEKKKALGVKLDTELDAKALKELAEEFKKEYQSKVGSPFPSDPKDQLMGAVKAVFRSWNNERAIYYRRMNDIPSSWGTAVNVQMMVFGNMGETSGTGVAFTRNPATGEKKLYGEFLLNAQGEDVVAGIRTPSKIEDLKNIIPAAYTQFVDICAKLEKHYKDMQDMEFTIEEEKLYMLQTRNGKRTAAAALKIACDLVDEGMISQKDAVLMVEPRTLDTLLHPTFEPKALAAAKAIATGLPASPGAASGRIAFTADEAVELAEKGEPVILVRHETSPEDIHGMDASKGILTVRGGMTSHAAVVARGMGTCCVCGCDAIEIFEEENYIKAGDVVIKRGEFISLDGSTGKVYSGSVPTIPAEIGGDFARLMGWADSYRTMKVRTNADTPRDAQRAVQFGAEGIGLCRTEHMFFDLDRIPAMREMILASTEEERKVALEKLLPMQRKDFEEIYMAMESRPVTIRFLDPPLHEFLPTSAEDIEALAKQTNKTSDEVRAIIASLHEFNPMMGHRGCRLAVTYPEIAVMQTKAVIEAALNVSKAHPEWNIVPEIMIPLVGEAKELAFVKKIVTQTADELIKNSGRTLKYSVGTMIEIPRAALLSDEIAEHAEFFSFGTNDLTQMTFGFSRDDAGKFLSHYYSKNIYEQDPFARLDKAGVGKLIEMSCTLGRKTRSDIKLGVCGEVGGDPSSIELFQKVGLSYVSCSPFRVPIARLAAAQAALRA